MQSHMQSQIPPSSPRCLPSRETTSSPAVKVEPDDYVFEFLASSTPSSSSGFNETLPTEVPLRATQACGDMRKMMGAFRLNPFAMHNAGSRATTASSGSGTGTWNGEEPGPLEEEPLEFEFQLVLVDEQQELRSFSPSFQIDNGVDGDSGDECSSQAPSLWHSADEGSVKSSGGSSTSHEFDYQESFPSQQGIYPVTIVCIEKF